MAIRTFPRATEPHHASLAAALAPILQAFLLRYDHGAVEIDHADFAGTTDAEIQALVDAAPITSPALDAKAAVERLSLREKAAYLTLLDFVNIERAQRGAAAITPAAFLAAVKAKVDAL